MDDNLKDKYKFEEEILEAWNNTCSYNGENQTNQMNLIKRYRYPIFSLVSFFVIVYFIINYLNLDNTNLSILILLFIISVILVITVHNERKINLNLFNQRSLEEFSNNLEENNVKTIDDYDRLIKRLNSKNEKYVKVKLMDGFSSNAIIGVIVFFIGGFFKEIFFGEGTNKVPISGDRYIINTLFVILLICMFRMFLVTLNNALNSDKDDLILLIDGLERIKYAMEQADSEDMSPKSDNVLENNEVDSSKNDVFYYIDNIDDAIYKLEKIYLSLMKINNRVEKLFSTEEKNNEIFKNKKVDDNFSSYKHTIYKEETRIK